MKMLQMLRLKIISFLGMDDIISRQAEMMNHQKLLEERISFLEQKATEISRAVATVALIQANMVREFGEISAEQEKKKTKIAYIRKTGDDFTN